MRKENSSVMRRANVVLHESLLDLMSVINSPQSDAKLLARAGVSLGRGLYPLLVRAARGPVAVSALAEQVGRDQSTVSRQVQELERQGLVSRTTDRLDARARVVAITRQGKLMAAKIARTREQLTDEALADWSIEQRLSLAEIMRKLADSVSSSLKRP